MASEPAIRAVCVFCGAKPGNAAVFAEIAHAAGRGIAERGWALVYGGGDIGLMGALAQGALSAGGEVIGVIPRVLLRQERGKHGLARLEIVETMAARKERMVAIADAFLTLPGGLGTLDELFEVLTLRQIGLHRKPVAILDHDGFFAPLLRAIDTMVAQGFVRDVDIDHLLVGPDLPDLLARLARR